MFANLCAMHRGTCEKFGSKVAIRYKDNGRYRDLNWIDYRWKADGGAAGFVELGIETGDRIAIFSENRHEWFVADHAMLSSGAVTVPLHAPLTADQAQYQISHSQARGVIVSNQAQADKIYEVLADLPLLEFIISFDVIKPKTDLPVYTFAGLIARGHQQGQAGRDEVLKREAALTEADLATIIYTSGTTGNPKGVMLSHGNLLSNAIATADNTGLDEVEILLSWLPYSHIYARTVDHYVTTFGGLVVAMGESVDTLVTNLAEIQPSWMTAVPRFYEKVWMSVEHLEPEARKKTLHSIFGPRLKQLCSGGAPLPRHVCEGFFAAGIPLLEGYGLTESSPVITFNSLTDWKIGTVGKTIDDVDVKIAADEEILARGPNIMQGYWRNPEATAETIIDGWLYTGDVGMIDDEGFLSITDRKKDLLITSGGKNIAPSTLERLMVSDEFIDQAVVYGDGRNFVSALVVPNFENLTAKCAELGVTLSEGQTFIEDVAVDEFLQSRVNEIMSTVSQPERVKKLLILASPFEQEAGELTATLKVRRRHIIQKYENELAALYEKSPSNSA